MIAADVFIRNVTELQLDGVVDEYQDHFICRPVPLWVDNGTEEEPDPQLLGYHAKVSSKFYRKAKAKWPTKIYLYQQVADKLSSAGAPLHVFGAGGCIETQIDPDVDEDVVVRFHIGKPYAVTTDGTKAYRIVDGALVRITDKQLADNGIVLESSIDN